MDIKSITTLLILFTLLLPSNCLATKKYDNQYYNDLKALTECLYYEARGESELGILAVGLVVAVRVKSKHYPDTFEGVVYQNKRVNGNKVYQFSYNSIKNKVYSNLAMWYKCRRLARYILANQNDKTFVGTLEGSDHYHSVDVKPYWIKSMTKVTQIDNHIFYRR